MHLGRHDVRLEEARLVVSQSERDALAEAEQICANADKMLREFVARCDVREREADETLALARAEAKRIKADARSEVARLIRDAITLVDAAIADARTSPADHGAGGPASRMWIAHPASAMVAS